LLDLFFLGWTAKLLWEQKLFLVQWNRLTDRQQAFFSAIFVVGTMLYYVGIHFAAHIILPSVVREIYLKSYFGFIVIWVSSFCWVSHRNAKLGTSVDSSEKREDGRKTEGLRRWWSAEENRINFLSVFIIALALVNPGSLRENLAWAVGIVILVQLLVRLRGWIVGLAFRGRYDWAIWLNRMFYWAPGYGRSFEGWILAEAGRDHEAEEMLRPLAFDESGQPRITSKEFYFYTQSLSNGGEEAKAQLLFEAAIQVPQTLPYFHIGLVVCLLDQKKDVTRALELMEKVLSTWPESVRSKQAHRIALHAWALACCGRHEEAESRLQGALADSGEFESRDLAWLHFYAGKTWRSLGNPAKARASFQEATNCRPHGNVEVYVKRRLAELGAKE